MERNRHHYQQDDMTRRGFFRGLGIGAVGAAAGALGLGVEQKVLQPEKPLIPDRIADVTQADGYRYNLTDNKGIGMDHLKIEEIAQGSYVGVYHHEINGRFYTRIATSNDFYNWEYKADIEADSSQAYIKRTNNGEYIVAYEKHDDNGNYIKVRYYQDVNSLLRSRHAKEIQLDKTLADKPGASEGTPTILSLQEPFDINTSRIQIAFHANDGTRDLPALGEIKGFNVATWKADWDTKRLQLFDSTAGINVQGNIGQVDVVEDNGQQVVIQEAQDTLGDFATFHLYTIRDNHLSLLNIQTHYNIRAFANPTWKKVTLPSGQKVLVVTAFVPSQAAPQGKDGELLYYITY